MRTTRQQTRIQVCPTAKGSACQSRSAPKSTWSSFHVMLFSEWWTSGIFARQPSTGVVVMLNMDPIALIGDIHGCSEELAELLSRLGSRRILSLGDVVDRGPDPDGCIRLLREHNALVV